MSKYSMTIFWSEDDQAFIVDVPELPGCMADGATRLEAVRNAERIIEEWIALAIQENREIPEPAMELPFSQDESAMIEEGESDILKGRVVNWRDIRSDVD